MKSFYGGPSGQSFEIAKIFNSKTEMFADLQQRWVSDVGVGAYVFISYGAPGSTEYNDNKTADDVSYKRVYNATLWQKIYIENPTAATDEDFGLEVVFASGNYGLGYRLITFCAGNTPRFIVGQNILDANDAPYVRVDNTNPDSPVLTFYLPHSWDFKTGQGTSDGTKTDIDVKAVSVNQPHKVTLTNVGTPTDPYLLKFGFELPKSQIINVAQVESVLNASQDPVVRLDIGANPGDTGSLDNPILKFSLPESSTFSAKMGTTLVPGSTPVVSAVRDNGGNSSNVTLTFDLPTTPVMQAPVTKWLAPNENPLVDDIGTTSKPQLRFSLPRAAKFYYGNLLGTQASAVTPGVTETTLTSPVEVLDYRTGDYYINANTGFVYQVIATTGSATTFRYEACIQAPLPQVSISPLDPFDASGNRVDPFVTSNAGTVDAATTWKMLFNLPKVPDFIINRSTLTFVGAAKRDEVDVTLSTIGTDTLGFNFKLSQGSRVYAGMDIATVTDMLVGDLFIDSNAGDIYEYIEELQSDGSTTLKWDKKDGTIKGATGPALNVVAALTYDNNTSGTGVADTLADISARIEADYGIPNGDEIIAVTYQTLNSADESIVDKETSYWYFYMKDYPTASAGSWGRVLLTAVANLIQNDYDPAGNVNKAYSVSYINALIDDVNVDDDVKAFSKKQVRQMLSWGKFSDLIPSTT